MHGASVACAVSKRSIEIPFPQRDLHVRSGRLAISIEKGDAASPPAG